MHSLTRHDVIGNVAHQIDGPLSEVAFVFAELVQPDLDHLWRICLSPRVKKCWQPCSLQCWRAHLRTRSLPWLGRPPCGGAVFASGSVFLNSTTPPPSSLLLYPWGNLKCPPPPAIFGRWDRGSGRIVVSSAQPLEPLKRNDANEVGLAPLTRDGAFLDTDQPLDLRLQQSSLGGLPTTTRPSGRFRPVTVRSRPIGHTHRR